MTVYANIYRETDAGEVRVLVQGRYDGPTHGLVDVEAADGSALTGDDADRAEQALLRALEGRR